MKVIKTLIIFLTIGFYSISTQSQDSIKIDYKKNSFKGFAFAFPYTIWINISSLGYERFITPKSSLSFTVNGFIFSNGSVGGNSFSWDGNVILSYNIFFTSKTRFLNNTWISPCFIYSVMYSSGYENHSDMRGIGGGLNAGKRMFLNKAKRLFIDFGFGVILTHVTFKSYFDTIGHWNQTTQQYDWTIVTHHNPDNWFIPRPILLIGYKF